MVDELAAPVTGLAVAGAQRRRSLAIHAAALAVVLVALFPLMSPNSAFTSDEGAYALQVKALEQGSWDYQYRAESLDPDGRYFPIILGDRGPSGFHPYAKHPAYPLLMRAATSLVGQTVGLHLLALLGVLGTAVAAWLLASELDPRLSRPAFWLAASGPVLVNGYLIWAHAPSAAVAGLALVGAVGILRKGVVSWAGVGTAAALAVGVLLRSEGVLFAAALALGLASILILRDRRPLAALAAAGGVIGPALVTTELERRWVSSIVGQSYRITARQGTVPSSFLEGRRDGAWHELLQGHFIDASAGVPVLVALLVVAGMGWLALRRWEPRSTRILVAGAVAAIALLVLRFAAHPSDPVTGLLPAWPLAVLGLLLMRWKGARPAVLMVAATSVLFTGAVLATQYPEGGGVEWGGRFLSPCLVGLAVLAAAGLSRAVDAAPSVDRPKVVVALVMVGVATAAFSLGTAGTLRARQDGVIAALARHPSPVTVTTHPALPRLAWRADDRLTWMLTDDAGLPGLMRDLRDQGVTEVTVVGHELAVSALSAYPSLVEQDEPALSGDGITMIEARIELSNARSTRATD